MQQQSEKPDLMTCMLFKNGTKEKKYNAQNVGRTVLKIKITLHLKARS